MRKCSGFGFLLVGLFIGAAIGGVAALLFSPVSGPETRRQMRNRLLTVADMAKNVAERAEMAADRLGEQVDHYLGRDDEVAWRKVREIREGVQRYTDARAPQQ
jgi:gas vesicle protein